MTIQTRNATIITLSLLFVLSGCQKKQAEDAGPHSDSSGSPAAAEVVESDTGDVPEPAASVESKAVMEWSAVRKKLRQDIPLPEEGVCLGYSVVGERGNLNFEVPDETIDDLMPIYEAMEQDGWVPLAANMNGRKNGRLAQFHNNKGPTQVGISLVTEKPGDTRVNVLITIGRNPRYRP